jgi:hypothetical protein
MKNAIVTIDHDPDVENPLEYDSWKVHSFCSRHSNYEHPSELGLGLYLGSDGLPPVENIGLKRKLEVGTAFILSYYEHGQGCWSLKGEGPQCRFDSTQIAGLLVWEGKPKDCGWASELEPDGSSRRSKFEKTIEARAKNARSTLEVYNEWCNGHCYQYSIKEYDEETEEEGEDIDSSSGFIGDKHLMDGIRDAIRGTGVRIVKADGECDFIIKDELPLLIEAKKKEEEVLAS